MNRYFADGSPCRISVRTNGAAFAFLAVLAALIVLARLPLLVSLALLVSLTVFTFLNLKTLSDICTVTATTAHSLHGVGESHSLCRFLGQAVRLLV